MGMNAKEKICCLTLDELSLTQNVEYDTNTDSLLGNVHFYSTLEMLTMLSFFGMVLFGADVLALMFWHRCFGEGVLAPFFFGAN